ncbi:MAG: Gfo/Idh/MocA family oxidoreductase [Thermoguttaceae bacterium]|nr:Gfo/Idh/MocA family oxidoreductase [Thermoguttaceae bacterium]
MTSRRDFLKTSTAVGSAMALGLGAGQHVHAAGSDVLKIGVIGCGGRGMGATRNCLDANPNAKLVAMAELFPDRAKAAHKAIYEAPQFKGRVDVPDNRLYVGLDGYKGVIADADVVLIACTSRFHPFYTYEAVKAKKHVFTEKPHGIDAAGVHQMLEAAELAKKNKTAIVSGLCYRYDLLRRQSIAKIRDGLIGEVLAGECNYIRVPYHLVPRLPEWSEVEYQFRNWYHFTWLTGDEILQSLLHNIDSVLGVMNEDLPEACYGVGGRSSSFIPEMGDMFDHTGVIFEYADGRRIYGMTRAALKCYSITRDVLHGTKGHCWWHGARPPVITDLKGNEIWTTGDKKPERPMTEQEHFELFQSIMNNKPINDGFRMSHSTMVAIMGMVASRSGQRVTYKELFDSKFQLKPTLEGLSLDKFPQADLLTKPGPNGLYPVVAPGSHKDY